MKKWIAILCAVAMLSLLCLTACGTPAETDEATGTKATINGAAAVKYTRPRSLRVWPEDD